ncbi:hypothetical protein DL764_007865 [Monosporascus ibericus]|uniref:TPR-like protein n=1 Tax=Monosporascus ibericus TaxID=155417 RepID=A0A4Q4T165_9PEZI|nr:hypothetical protein DL764_007865 [Monosporascus ibericus]
MSHPFSSTFDALQAHFTKKATQTEARFNDVAPGAPPPVEDAASDQMPKYSSHHPAMMGPRPVQHVPAQHAGSEKNSPFQPSTQHEAWYVTATFARPIPPTTSDLGSSEMVVDSPNHPQLSGSHLNPGRPSSLDHNMPSSETSIDNIDSDQVPPGSSPSLRGANPPYHNLGFATGISTTTSHVAPTADASMDGVRFVIQAPNPAGSRSSNPLAVNANQQLGTEGQTTPMDIVIDPLLQQQNKLKQLQDAQEKDTRPEERGGDEFNQALQVSFNIEGSLGNTTGRHIQPGSHHENGARGSGQPPTRGRARVPKKRGPRKAAEPTGDVKLRLNMASEAYVQGRIDDAIKLVEDAIRINAEIHRAWILLAQLFEERGELKKRLTAQICAAQLEPKDVDAWLSTAQEAVALRDIYPDDADELTRQAIFCYSAALRADVESKSARHGRAALSLDRGYIKGAAKDYAFLVDRLFYDVYALRGLAETSVLLAENNPEYPFDWEDVYIIVDLLAYIKEFKGAIYELKSLARWLLNRSEESFWDECVGDDREWDADSSRRLEVHEFREGQYPDTSYGNGLPLQLRAKLGVCRLELDQEDEAMRHFEWLDPTSGRVTELLSEYSHLVLEAASALYDKNKYSLALGFYEPLWDVPGALDANALLKAGRCYLSLGDKRQAEECFTAAIDVDELNYQPCIDARLELARMYEAAREDREAYILVSEAIKLQEAQEEEEPLDDDLDVNAEEEDEDMDEEEFGPSSMSLDPKPRGKQQQRKKPSRRVAGIRPEKPKPKVQRPLRSLQPRVPRQRPRVFGLSEEVQKEEERRAAELASHWQTVRASRHEPRSSEDGPSQSFMSAAGALIDDFRSYKDFYSWDKYLSHLGIKQAEQKLVTRNRNLVEMAERLSHTPGESGPIKPTSEKFAIGYRGVPFSEWLDLFLEYAMGLAHYGRFQDAYKVCESARDAVVFSNSKEDLFLIHVAWAACALRGRDEEICIAMARYFTSKYQFDTDAFRMFSALSRLCPSPASWYASGPVQKFLLRQIRIMDTTLRPRLASGAESPGEDRAPEQTTYPGKELDATLLMLYGHVLFISNSFTYALNYLLRALSIDPSNTMIALSIGQCYIQDGLKRQSDNRQYLLAQGFAFLHRYYEARLLAASSSEGATGGATTKKKNPNPAALRQEAHYNLARTYHGVGIPHLAAEYYRRALLEEVPGKENGRGGDEDGGIMGSQDLSREAAFNLQQLCLAGGDMETVRALGDRFLVI